jgi:hypothetical protein
MELTVTGRLLDIEGREALWLTADPCVPIEAAGEQFNQSHIERVVDECGGRMGIPLVTWLVPEPANQNDPNAVMLWLHGGKVGYLPRELASVWTRFLRQLGDKSQRQLACASHLRLPNPRAKEVGYQVVAWLPKLPGQIVQAVDLHEIPFVMWKAEEERIAREEKKAKAEDRKRRAEHLREQRLSKYDPKTAQLIEEHRVWRGQTVEMLDLACGKPDKVQEKVLKTKTKRTLEYRDVFGVGAVCEKCDGEGRIPEYAHIGGGICFRCGGTGTGGSAWVLRVTLDDDVVVAYEDRRSST